MEVIANYLSVVSNMTQPIMGTDPTNDLLAEIRMLSEAQDRPYIRIFNAGLDVVNSWKKSTEFQPFLMLDISSILTTVSSPRRKQ